MAQALYRKWRPARFDEVVGQEHITQTLQNAVAANRLGHAYLFSGPRGTGKTTIARLVAKAANCLDEDLSHRPCNRCSPCLAINQGRFLDLIEIDAASNTGVDDIRDLREKINFAPGEGRYKVYIIDEVHMLSTAAFNALLKTLEEPPAHALFVLATTEEHKVPLTIKSRCQQFNFRLLTNQEIVGRLTWLADQENLSIEHQALTMIAHHATGSLRDAESLLDQLVVAPGDTITLNRAQKVLGTASDEAISSLTSSLLAGDGAGGLEIIHHALGSGADARQFARQMVAYLRKLLLLQTAGRNLPIDATAEQMEVMIQQAKDSRRQHLIDAVKHFNEAATSRTGSWQPQLPLELAFIELLPQHVKRDAEYGHSNEVQAEDALQEVEPAIAQEWIQPEAPPATKTGDEVEASQEPITDVVASDSSSDSPPMDKALQETKREIPTILSLEQVTAQWPKLREYAGHQDKNLPPLLAACKPLAVEGDVLILGFDYPILKDKFDKKHQAGEIVGKGLGELLGISCIVRTVVTDQYIPTTSSIEIAEEDISALAEELGGIAHEPGS